MIAAAAAVAAAAGCCCCCCNIAIILASVSRNPSVMCMAALLGCNCSSNHNGNFQVYNINPAGDSFLAMQTTPQRLQSRKSPTRSSLAWMAIKSPSAFASLQMQCLGSRVSQSSYFVMVEASLLEVWIHMMTSAATLRADQSTLYCQWGTGNCLTAPRQRHMIC